MIFPILLCYNSPTYCDHMLNPSILDGWEDLHWIEDYPLAKAVTITGEHPETRVKDKAPNEVIGQQHQRLRGVLQLS